MHENHVKRCVRAILPQQFGKANGESIILREIDTNLNFLRRPKPTLLNDPDPRSCWQISLTLRHKVSGFHPNIN
jgi:hypothetical protein